MAWFRRMMVRLWLFDPDPPRRFGAGTAVFHGGHRPVTLGGSFDA